MSPSCFDRVVVTASNRNQCDLFKLELQHLRETKPGMLGLSPQTEIFSVSDPLGIRVGSGGATFHAMAECYETRKSLLILHSGGDSRRNPLCCVAGKGFASLNFAQDSSNCPLERLLSQVSLLFPKKCGVLVCCTDTLMTNLERAADDKNVKCFADNAVTGIGIYTPWDFGTRHGVFYSNPPGSLAPFGILQKATEQKLRATLNCIDNNDQVLLDSGLIHFGVHVADGVMQAMKQDLQFRGLTNDGMDAGLLPAKFELYTDFLQSLQGMSATEEKPFTLRFQNFTFQVMQCDKQCEFIHLGTTKEHLEFVSSLESKIPLQLISHSFYSSTTAVNAVLINSLVDCTNGDCTLGESALLEHCELSGSCRVGKLSVLSQIRSNDKIIVEDKICVQYIDTDPTKLAQRLQQTLPLQCAYCCYSVFGIEDGVKEIFPGGTYCNRSWKQWPTEITQCLWSDEPSNRSLWTAKLFPVLPVEGKGLEVALWLMRGGNSTDANTFEKWRNALRVSLSDLVWIANVHEQFTWNRITLPRRILARQLRQSLLQRTAYPPQLGGGGGVDALLLDALDNNSLQFQDDSINARTMSLIADLLCYNRTSGNGCHPDFAPALAKLASSLSLSVERKQAVSMLALVRNSPYWQQHPLRVARHYDLASQLLTGKSLQTTSNELKLPLPNASVLSNRWVHVTAPCRIDLSGGWTDTPPITSEAGGFVCNVAVNLEPNVHSLGASCRLVDASNAKFHLRFGRFDEESADGCQCTTAQDFADHGNPQAKCALLKCVLLALFPLHSLLEFNFELELCMWSDLPGGSGLGGSSILAACALLACSRALGLKLEHNEIYQLVLKVEQLLSTGGGWQDQIGAIYPGFKLTSCKPTLPLELQVFQLPVDDAQYDWFEQKGVLVQTGPARLARDLLQVVVRRWHRREPEFCKAVHELKTNALSMTASLMLGNVQGVEHEINKYWDLKKQVCGAEQAEPREITRLFLAVQDMVAAKMLCGAGGGGFAFFLLRDGASFADFAHVTAEQFPEMKTFPVSVCKRGLCAWEEDV